MIEPNLQTVIPEIENRTGMFNLDAATRVGDRLRPPAGQGCFDDNARRIFRRFLDDNFGGHDFYTVSNVAVNFKRRGDLLCASAAYQAYFCAEDDYDKELIWPWIKVMLLAKNFEDAWRLSGYLYAFNACINRSRRASGESLSAYSSWGSTPPLYWGDWVPGAYLRQISGRGLSSKREVEDAISAYGGSDYWNNFWLTDSEYNEFRDAFWG